jgi:hypothetical protein
MATIHSLEEGGSVEDQYELKVIASVREAMGDKLPDLKLPLPDNLSNEELRERVESWILFSSLLLQESRELHKTQEDDYAFIYDQKETAEYHLRSAEERLGALKCTLRNLGME